MSDSSDKASSDARAAGKVRKTRRWWMWLTVVLLCIALFLVLLPTLVIQSGLFDKLVSRRLAKHDLEARIKDPTIGWFTPLQFGELEVLDRRSLWRLTAKQLRGDKTLGQWLWKSSDLGTFTLSEPMLLVELGHPLEAWQRDPPAPTADASAPRTQRFRFQIEKGTLLVKRPDAEQPETVVGQIDLDALWETSPSGKLLTIAPGRPLQRVQLTPEMCDLGLKYVAPIFARVAWTSGDLSLELEHCLLPLHDPSKVEVTGRVTLHSVETGLKNPLAERLASLAATVTEKELPKSVRVADGSVIEFTVQDQRVSHTGLEFGLPTLSPELVIRTHGSVGFDKTLDLLAEIPMPTDALGDNVLKKLFAEGPLSLPIGGTLDDPQVSAGEGQLASQVLDKFMNSEALSELNTEEIVESLQEMRDRIRERREENGPLLPRRRQRWLRGER